MPIDFSFLESAAPKQQESQKLSGLANVSIRVDADCFMLCDGEYIDLPLKAGMMAKTQIPVGQHLLEFFSQETPNIKVEKQVDFPQPNRNYLVMVNDLKAAIAPPVPQQTQQQAPPSNLFLDQLNQMARMNPLGGMCASQMPPVPPIPPQNDNINGE